VAGQQLQPDRDRGEHHVAEPAPLQGQVPEQQHQRHPGDHLELVHQDDVLQGDRAEAEREPGQGGSPAAGAQPQAAVGPHAEPGQGDVEGADHLEGGRGGQEPERQVARVEHGVLEVGQERLAAVLVVQPGRQEPGPQQLGEAVLLGPEEAEQHVVVEALPAAPQRRQERQGEQLQHQVDDQALHCQGAAGQRAAGVGPAGLRGRLGRRDHGGPVGDVALHAATPLGGAGDISRPKRGMLAEQGEQAATGR
jgi:hypothetical protein